MAKIRLPPKQNSSSAVSFFLSWPNLKIRLDYSDSDNDYNDFENDCSDFKRRLQRLKHFQSKLLHSLLISEICLSISEILIDFITFYSRARKSKTIPVNARAIPKTPLKSITTTGHQAKISAIPQIKQKIPAKAKKIF